MKEKDKIIEILREFKYALTGIKADHTDEPAIAHYTTRILESPHFEISEEEIGGITEGGIRKLLYEYGTCDSILSFWRLESKKWDEFIEAVLREMRINLATESFKAALSKEAKPISEEGTKDVLENFFIWVYRNEGNFTEEAEPHHYVETYLQQLKELKL